MSWMLVSDFSVIMVLYVLQLISMREPVKWCIFESRDSSPVINGSDEDEEEKRNEKTRNESFGLQLFSHPEINP